MAHGTCGTNACKNVGQLRRGWCESCYDHWRKNDGDDPANRAGLQAKPNGRCQTQGCTYKGPLTGDGNCDPCRQWARRHPDQDPAERKRRQAGPDDGQCTVILGDGTKCTEPHDSRGMCPAHRSRWMLHGNPTTVARRSPNELQELIQAAAVANIDQCIILDGHGRRPLYMLDGETMNAARAVWIVANGDPGDNFVLHTCHQGKEGCVNIRHLYLGDHGQNMIDMTQAERQARGEENGCSKLTNHQVREIRRRYVPRDRNGNSGRALADEFGVSATAISYVVQQKTWDHVTGS